MAKCRKCGFENPEELKFCGGCGAKLGIEIEAPKYEGLALLHITGSVYLLISSVFNSLIQISIIFMGLCIASGLLGLYAGYEFYRGKASKWLKIISALAIAIGLAFTSTLFMIGLGVRGVIGPSWIIFLITAWALLKRR